jgi:hypothetical protein
MVQVQLDRFDEVAALVDQVQSATTFNFGPNCS